VPTPVRTGARSLVSGVDPASSSTTPQRAAGPPHHRSRPAPSPQVRGGRFCERSLSSSATSCIAGWPPPATRPTTAGPSRPQRRAALRVEGELEVPLVEHRPSRPQRRAALRGPGDRTALAQRDPSPSRPQRRAALRACASRKSHRRGRRVPLVLSDELHCGTMFEALVDDHGASPSRPQRRAALRGREHRHQRRPDRQSLSSSATSCIAVDTESGTNWGRQGVPGGWLGRWVSF